MTNTVTPATGASDTGDAVAAARALLPIDGLTAREIAQRALEIAADICVYTNRHITILELPGEK